MLKVFMLLPIAVVAFSGAGKCFANPNSVAITTICLADDESKRNKDSVLEAIREACRESDSDLMVVPFTPFLEFRSHRVAEDISEFASLAKQHQTYLVVAMTERDGDQTFATSAVIDREGQVAFKYRKTHLLADDETHSAGDRLDVYETDFGTIGLTIGTDFYFPEIYEVLRMKGAEILLWQHFPERVREHRTWEPLLASRAIDSHAHLVTAHFADSKPYLTNHLGGSIGGSAFGRSQIINRVGIPLASTGIQSGAATAKIDLDHRPGGVDKAKAENTFYVHVTSDRKAFSPLTQASPRIEPIPNYAKRQARIAIIALEHHHIWRRGGRPEKLLEMIEQAGQLNVDLVLASEQQAYLDDDTVRESMPLIAAAAAKIKAYVCVGGIRPDDGRSTAHLWNRNGELVWKQGIYWSRGMDQFKVFDTDFARISAHSCGDLHAPMVDRTLAIKGAELILDPSQMWGPNGATNETLQRARAVDNGVWMACARWNSSDPGLRSQIVDPYGQVMASSPFGQDRIIYLDIDFDQTRHHYAGEREPRGGLRSMADYKSDSLPIQQSGWQNMIFSRRRPELYDILTESNDVVRQYRYGSASTKP